MSKIFTTVIVGCGGISGAWFPVLKNFKNVAVLGLVDLNLDNALKVKEKYGLEKAEAGTDFKAMLKEKRPDFVINLTVPQAHAPLSMEAFRNGCHVLCEKPMADSMENARKINRAAKKYNKQFIVAQNRRYNNDCVRFTKMLHDKGFGPLTTLNSDFYIATKWDGFRKDMKHVLLLDMAIHTFDAARMISKADPVSVYCKEWNPPGSYLGHGGSAMAIFEMTGDIVYSYRGSWCNEGMDTSWEANWHAACTHGSLSWDGQSEIKAQQIEKFLGSCSSKVKNIPVLQSSTPLDRNDLFRDFLRAINTGKVVQNSGSDNIKSLAMVFGAVKSAETGKRVRIRT